MATETTAAVLEGTGAERPHRVRSTAFADYRALTKPEVTFLIAMTTFAVFCLASPTPSHPFPFMLLIHTLLGTLLVAGGTGTLNQYVERRVDAQMRRTAGRPVASGRIEPSHALGFGPCRWQALCT
jgi:protoheme IX farnesyltransferase